MATYHDINLQKITFNKVTKSEYDNMVSEGSLNENEFYLISDIDYATQDWVTEQISSATFNTEQAEIFFQMHNRIWDGRDLTTVFADEIANYSDEWAWIQARIQAGNYTGIYVGDYIPMTISSGTIGSYSIASQTFNCQIAGIDTYMNCGDTEIGHHIDFISQEVIDTDVVWNPENNNNGTADEANPWLASHIYAWLNGVNNYSTNAYNSVAHGGNYSSGGILQLLPSKLSDVIITKRGYLDQRYSSSGLLAYSTSWSWGDCGKLWLPSETEVYGQQVRSNLGYGSGYWNPENGLSAPYPLFQWQARNRVKRTSSGSRSTWWLLSTEAYTSTTACYVSYYGFASSYYCATSGIRSPLCFRVA